jgi:hypothetical protein
MKSDNFHIQSITFFNLNKNRWCSLEHRLAFFHFQLIEKIFHKTGVTITHYLLSFNLLGVTLVL